MSPVRHRIRTEIRQILAGTHPTCGARDVTPERPVDVTDLHPSLAQIRKRLGHCERCTLCAERTNIVFGVGDPEADLVIIGEAPGANEDRRGEPFVGKAGKMLDKMLEHVLGLKRDEVYIANVVKCQPPNNRDPMRHEVEACLPFLTQQIQAIQPKVMLVFGTVALKGLWNTPDGVHRNRGTWRSWSSIPAMVTYHPAYLLRRPEDKHKTHGDLLQVKERYDLLEGKRSTKKES